MSLEVKIGKLKLKNPIIAASGTFGFGQEMSKFYDVSALGAVVTKTITLEPRKGNPTPRVVETPSGMLNSIGLENVGLHEFILNKIKILERLKMPVIVSIAGDDIKDFRKLAEELSGFKCVSALELNLSCPNIKHKPQSGKFKLIAQDSYITEKVVSSVRKKTKLTIIVKLSPNITDICEIGKAAETAGADAISAVNTVFGLKVDITNRKAFLGNTVGGLSGPAIKPIALYFVRELYQAVKIPIIGMGGIMSAEDVYEFILCGAQCVQVGTANFVDPDACRTIVEDLKRFVEKNRISDIMSHRGKLGLLK